MMQCDDGPFPPVRPHTGVPVVSIVITAYNEEARIEQAVRNALADTEPAIELIVVDDGSTDGTAKVLRSLAGQDRRVRVIEMPLNQGLRAARAVGLKAATGEYVTFCDADDRMHPNKVSAMYEAATGSDADLVVAGYDQIALPAGRVTYRARFERQVLGRGEALERFCMGDLGSAVMWNKLYRRTLVLRHASKPLPRELDFGEDYIVAFGCFMEADKVVTMPGAWHTYLVDGNNMSRSKSGSDAFALVFRCYAACLEIYAGTLGQRIVWVDRLYARLLNYDAYRVGQGAQVSDTNQRLFREGLEIMARVHPAGIQALVHAFRSPSIVGRGGRSVTVIGRLRRAFNALFHG